MYECVMAFKIIQKSIENIFMMQTGVSYDDSTTSGQHTNSATTKTNKFDNKFDYLLWYVKCLKEGYTYQLLIGFVSYLFENLH